ncbi:MAG TPA: hypothetical protein VG317_09985 [Pseudonocardiaceae bacterium]|nr:hypothetical protein [Pseudonocardiaceae bacterium]
MLEAEFASSFLASVTLVEQGECGDGLPERPVTVGAARDVVHDPRADLAVCDAVFAALVRRVQTSDQHAQLAAIWVMLPGLRAIAHRLRRTWRADIDDIHSDAVVGFLEALRAADPGRQNLGAHLWWATYRHARRPCETFVRETATEDIAMLAARTATSDHANNPPAEPIRSGNLDAASVGSPVADSGVEGERLRSLAHRLGLHSQLHSDHRTRNRRRRIGYLTLHNIARSHPRAVGDAAVGIEREDDAA